MHGTKNKIIVDEICLQLLVIWMSNCRNLTWRILPVVLKSVIVVVIIGEEVDRITSSVVESLEVGEAVDWMPSAVVESLKVGEAVDDLNEIVLER